MGKVIEKMKEKGKEVFDDIISLKLPKLVMPIRSLQNVKYDQDKGHFVQLGKMKERNLTASTIKTFAQTLRMMTLSKEIIEKDDIATKREAYYVSKNWEEARFKEQPESDAVMDDVEAMMGVNREQLGFLPEEDGGAVSGELVIIDSDPETGEEIRVDCTKFASGAYSIPNKVDDFRFETKAKFILAVETAGMFQRLVKHKYWRRADCIIVSLKGVPSRATRRFIRKLSEEKKISVYVFTDGDFYGYMNIYRTLKVGSGNASHINEYFCVPEAKFIGVTPQDIVEYNLPSHPLKEVDIKRGKDAIKNDPFVHAHKEWKKAIELQLRLGKRAEQQAFAAYDLNYVMSEYLPKKLAEPKGWLP